MPGRRSYVLASSSSAQVAAEMEDKRSSRRRFSDLLNDDEDYGKMKMWFLLTDLLVFVSLLQLMNCCELSNKKCGRQQQGKQLTFESWSSP